jgi:hypothetical protein
MVSSSLGLRVIGFWLDDVEDGGMRYRVSDPETGRFEDVYIMVAEGERNDHILMTELAHKARESVAKGWKAKEPNKPLTVDQRKDLGQIMKQIKSSHDYWRENLHPRYWEGIK